jgi:phosphatidylserine decarboxylase
MKAFKHFFFAYLFPLVPKRLLSRGTGLLMRIPLPGLLGRVLIPRFARFFKIVESEAELPAASYGSFNAFFTRRLKPGLRPIQAAIVHPADSKLTQNGNVMAGQLLQAKGWTYSLSEFLGDEALAKQYEGGSYYTYYLCPADYHRVHASAGGRLVSASHIPGLLWPVNEWSVTNVKRLFCLNERVVLNFESPRGKWSSVLVGATNVGQISITLDPSISTNKWLWHKPTTRDYSPPIDVGVGDELGMFHLGSTVINVFEKGFALPPKPASFVKMGEAVVEKG